MLLVGATERRECRGQHLLRLVVDLRDRLTDRGTRGFEVRVGRIFCLHCVDVHFQFSETIDNILPNVCVQFFSCHGYY